MHIIYIHSHDTGRYIEPYGHQVSTPNLMQLAREGTLFRQAYCAAPSCSPSRSALLTGMTPHSNGMIGLAHRGFRMHDPSRHLSHYLSRQGYETVLCGIQHEAEADSELGYKHILHEKRQPGESLAHWDLANARKTADFIRRYAEGAGPATESESASVNTLAVTPEAVPSTAPATASEAVPPTESETTSASTTEPASKPAAASKTGRRPLFLSFGMVSTHREFPDGHDVNPDYVIPPYPLYDSPANRRDMAAFIASAAVMDECAGIVLSALRETGLEDDALIIYTTDHGIAFPRMKCTLSDAGIGVALIMKMPGHDNRLAGQSTDALVSQLDLFPTLCDAAGIPQPEWLEGASLMPLFSGAATHIRDAICAELSFHAAREPMRGIRTDRYKLIRRYETPGTVLPSNVDDGPAKQFLLDAGWLQYPTDPAPEQLFDLYLDPLESHNVRSEAAYAGIGAELSRKLDDWMRETDDPLLREGGLRAPAGARVNVRTSLHPSDRDFES